VWARVAEAAKVARSTLRCRSTWLPPPEDALAARSCPSKAYTPVRPALDGLWADRVRLRTNTVPLRGKVLPVGGIKEKVLAAHRAGIETVILPRQNERDLEDVPAELRREMRFVPVDMAEEVLARALEPRAVGAAV
jgi:hypothetical protein